MRNSLPKLFKCSKRPISSCTFTLPVVASRCMLLTAVKRWDQGCRRLLTKVRWQGKRSMGGGHESVPGVKAATSKMLIRYSNGPPAQPQPQPTPFSPLLFLPLRSASLLTTSSTAERSR